MDTITIGFAIWGAVSSVASVILGLVAHRHRILRQLKVTVYSDAPFDTLGVEVVNNGSRPMTITSVVIGYGSSGDDVKPLVSIFKGLPLKLTDSDAWVAKFDRAKLVASAREKKIDRVHYGSLWASVRTTTSGYVTQPARIHPDIISKEYDKPFEQWIATEAFLKFPKDGLEKTPRGYVQFNW